MTRKEIQDLRNELRKAHTLTLAERQGLREAMAKLASPQEKRKHSPEHYNELRTAARQEVKDMVHPVVLAVRGKAAAAVALRQHMIEPTTILAQGRFGSPLAPPNYSERQEQWRPGGLMFDENRERLDAQHRQAANLMIELTEQMTRVRWRLELPTYTGSELASLAQQCTVEGNHALLDLVRRETSTRDWSTDKRGEDLAKSAVIAAVTSIPLPKGVEEEVAMLTEIEKLSEEMDEAHLEIMSGQERQDRKSINRISELSREHGPIEGARRFGRERQKEIAELRKIASGEPTNEQPTDEAPLDASA